MQRIVEPEWLDELPADDPRAERSRRDIQRINRFTGHDRILSRALKSAFQKTAPQSIADLGAGNGNLLLNVARRLRWRNVNAILVDRVNGFAPEVPAHFRDLGWRAETEISDALAWLHSLGDRKIDVVIANHFFHQIENRELAEIFSLLSKSANVVIAAEPRRGPWPLLCSKFVWLLGSAPVTCNDAPISVRAGFRGSELSELWPHKKNWQLTEHWAGWFSHLFIARLKEN
jgi:SAM-dependent methyltransferase